MQWDVFFIVFPLVLWVATINGVGVSDMHCRYKWSLCLCIAAVQMKSIQLRISSNSCWIWRPRSLVRIQMHRCLWFIRSFIHPFSSFFFVPWCKWSQPNWESHPINVGLSADKCQSPFDAKSTVISTRTWWTIAVWWTMLVVFRFKSNLFCLSTFPHRRPTNTIILNEHNERQRHPHLHAGRSPHQFCSFHFLWLCPQTNVLVDSLDALM